MATYRHPHLVRGIVHTPYGAFTVVRGFVELPEDVGTSVGWTLVDEASRSIPPPPAPTTPDTHQADGN